MTITDEFKREALISWRGLDTKLKQPYLDEAKAEKPKEKTQARDRRAFQGFLVRFIATKKHKEYQQYPEGLIKWVEDNVRFKIESGKKVTWKYFHELSDTEDEYGRSQKKFWEHQKAMFREALQSDEDNVLKYNLIVLCWPRGEAKSFDIALICMHKFFNFAFQKIRLSSNTKTQTDDVHMSVIKETIENSPKLYALVGEEGITDEGVKILKQGRGRYNSILPMSQVSGIASNVNIIVQSEAFAQKSSKFFTEAAGSIRGITNALYLIDTTAATKGHWLYKSYKAYLTDPNGGIYFSYRDNPEADPACLWNPGVTKKQLDMYEKIFTRLEFAKFFRNLWEYDGTDFFDPDVIASIQYLGVDGKRTIHDDIMRILKRKGKFEQSKKLMQKRFDLKNKNHDYRQDADESGVGQLWGIDSVYTFGEQYQDNEFKPPTIRNTAVLPGLPELNMLSEIYDTDWAVLVGMDRAEGLKSGNRLIARTIIVWVLKGLPGSRGKSKSERISMSGNAAYEYVLFGVAHILDSHMHSMVAVVKDLHERVDGVTMAFAETALMHDVKYHLLQSGIPADMKYASTANQAMGFTDLIQSINSGRFKAPFVPIPGSISPDIVREEMAGFDAQMIGKTIKYGSPTKYDQGGVQDDCMDALGWAVFGGLEINADQFEPRNVKVLGNFGGLFPGMTLVQDLVGGHNY